MTGIWAAERSGIALAGRGTPRRGHMHQAVPGFPLPLLRIPRTLGKVALVGLITVACLYGLTAGVLGSDSYRRYLPSCPRSSGSGSAGTMIRFGDSEADCSIPHPSISGTDRSRSRYFSVRCWRHRFSSSRRLWSSASWPGRFGVKSEKGEKRRLGSDGGVCDRLSAGKRRPRKSGHALAPSHWRVGIPECRWAGASPHPPPLQVMSAELHAESSLGSDLTFALAVTAMLLVSPICSEIIACCSWFRWPWSGCNCRPLGSREPYSC